MDMNKEELADGTLRVRLNGRLDTIGVDQVETRFNATVAASGRDAVVDLSQVSFVSSMGVRLIITAARAQRARGHRMVLFGAQPSVATTLEMVALDQVVPIVTDETQALAHLAQAG